MKTNLYPIARKCCGIILFCMIATTSYAQQAAEIDPKSLILSRYANLTAITTAIPTPTQGMQVYNIATKSNWFYNGTAWTDTKSQWVTSGNNIYNANSSFVGIGKSNPDAPLDVRSPAGLVARFDGTNQTYVSIGENGVYRGYWGSFAGAAEDLDFGTGNTNTTGKLHLTIKAVPKLTVAANGQVGIGTMNPEARLHLISAGNAIDTTSALILRNSVNNTLFKVRDNGNVGIGTTNPTARLGIKSVGNTDATNALSIKNSTDASLFHVLDNGHAGIGTSTPERPLDIIHGGGNALRIKSTSGYSSIDIDAASGDAAIRFMNNGTGQWNLRNQAGTGNLQILELGVGGERLVIQDATGNVGISDNSPTEKLSVTGKIKMNDGNQAIGKVLTSDADGVGSWQPVPSGQFVVSGSDIYYSSGNVGIGTPAPVVTLDVKSISANVAQFNGTSSMFLSIYEDDIYRGYWGSYAGAAEDVDFGTGGGNTTGSVHLTIEANPKLTINPLGNVGIGTTDPKATLHLNGAMLVGDPSARIADGYMMSVDGKVIAEDFTTMNSTSWPDYVFEKDYKLLPLEQLEKSIQQNKHLPNIPSAAEVEKNGIALGEMNKKLMEKVEELTLYMIDLNKKNTALTKKLEKLEKVVSSKK